MVLLPKLPPPRATGQPAKSTSATTLHVLIDGEWVPATLVAFEPQGAAGKPEYVAREARGGTEVRVPAQHVRFRGLQAEQPPRLRRTRSPEPVPAAQVTARGVKAPTEQEALPRRLQVTHHRDTGRPIWRGLSTEPAARGRSPARSARRSASHATLPVPPMPLVWKPMPQPASTGQLLQPVATDPIFGLPIESRGRRALAQVGAEVAAPAPSRPLTRREREINSLKAALGDDTTTTTTDGIIGGSGGSGGAGRARSPLKTIRIPRPRVPAGGVVETRAANHIQAGWRGRGSSELRQLWGKARRMVKVVVEHSKLRQRLELRHEAERLGCAHDVVTAANVFDRRQKLVTAEATRVSMVLERQGHFDDVRMPAVLQRAIDNVHYTRYVTPPPRVLVPVQRKSKKREKPAEEVAAAAAAVAEEEEVVARLEERLAVMQELMTLPLPASPLPASPQQAPLSAVTPAAVTSPPLPMKPTHASPLPVVRVAPAARAPPAIDVAAVAAHKEQAQAQVAQLKARVERGEALSVEEAAGLRRQEARVAVLEEVMSGAVKLDPAAAEAEAKAAKVRVRELKQRAKPAALTAAAPKAITESFESIWAPRVSYTDGKSLYVAHMAHTLPAHLYLLVHMLHRACALSSQWRVCDVFDIVGPTPQV